jgi:hypothetical protein
MSKENQEKGKKVTLSIKEKADLFTTHNGELTDEKPMKSGEISVQNPSAKDRVWDLELMLNTTDNTNLKDKKITIKELAPSAVQKIKYLPKLDVRRDIEITEFVSALNNPQIESYTLALNVDNEIYTSIALKNSGAEKIREIHVKKEIPSGFSRSSITKTDLGKTRTESTKIKYYNEKSQIEEHDVNAIIWDIESLDPGVTVKMYLKFFIRSNDKKQKVRNGRIMVEYISPSTFSNIKIDKFQGYSHNNFYINTEELEAEPNKYKCQFVFENKSEFAVKLTDVIVGDSKDKNQKFVNLTQKEIAFLSENEKWSSPNWEYKSIDGTNPCFPVKTMFSILPMSQIETIQTVNIADIELYVAALDGFLKYDVTEIPSFKLTPFNAHLQLENVGSAPLDQVVLTDVVPKGFLAPAPEEVVMLYNGKEINLPKNAIKYEPGTSGSSQDHAMSISLKDLRYGLNDEILAMSSDEKANKAKAEGIEEGNWGFKPGDKIELKYAITADRPSKSVTFNPNVYAAGNTYPAGKPIEFILSSTAVAIPVTHMRKSFISGKELIATGVNGEFIVDLYIFNNAKYDMHQYKMEDIVPSGFKFAGLIVNDKLVTNKKDVHEGVWPTTSEKEGKVTLKWIIEPVPANKRVDMKYKIVLVDAENHLDLQQMN